MKSLAQYLTENKVPSYLTVWEKIDWDKNDKNIGQKIEDGIKSTIDKTKIVVINNLEELDKQRTAKFESDIVKAAERAAMKYKRVMKYDEARRAKWIADKVAEIKTDPAKYFIKKTNTDIKFDENRVDFKIRKGFYTDGGASEISLKYGLDDIIKSILKPIGTKEADHLQSINICSTPSVGADLLGGAIVYEVIYVFDDELEEEMARSQQEYADAVSAMYDSGHYMGD